MDRYVTVVKHTTKARSGDIKEARAERRPHPYERPSSSARDTLLAEDKERVRRLMTPLREEAEREGRQLSGPTITRHILKTLSDESNPITHSNIYHRTDHVISCTTGHQRGEGRGAGARLWTIERSHKLNEQRRTDTENAKAAANSSSALLAGVRVYIGGYMRNTTDIAMKRAISLAGGTTLSTASGATHILTSQQLSGSKTQKHLTKKRRNGPVHVVRPEWVTDSIEAGRRLSESQYAFIKPAGSQDLREMFKTSSSRNYADAEGSK